MASGRRNRTGAGAPGGYSAYDTFLPGAWRIFIRTKKENQLLSDDIWGEGEIFKNKQTKKKHIYKKHKLALTFQ